MKEDGLRYIYYLQVCTWGIPHESCITYVQSVYGTGDTHRWQSSMRMYVIECKIPDKVTF